MSPVPSGMTPAVARIKKGIARSIELNGGGDGAAATVGRARTVAYDWGNLNHPALPRIDQAFTLDEVAMSVAVEAPILAACARELGGVFVPLAPGVPITLGTGGIHAALACSLKEHSEAAETVIAGFADGQLCARDLDRAIEQAGEAIEAGVRLKATLERMREDLA